MQMEIGGLTVTGMMTSLSQTASQRSNDNPVENCVSIPMNANPHERLQHRGSRLLTALLASTRHQITFYYLQALEITRLVGKRGGERALVAAV